MMKKLYSLTLPLNETRAPLYIKGLHDGVTPLNLNKDQLLDFITYFNAFCVEKWRQFTTISAVRLRLELRGRFRIVFKIVDTHGAANAFLSEEIINPHYEHDFPLPQLPECALLGFTLTSLEDGGAFLGGAWYGEFDFWRERTIGVSICTFKREEYVTRTVKILDHFSQSNPWLRVLVVDNGGTLPIREDNTVRVIHSRNYGGSGGFTRGMIEYAEQKNNPDYVLLMDDDIILDPTAIERTHSLLCGLKKENSDSFVAGAMLPTDNPTTQFENTAYWNGVTNRSNYQNWDLTDICKLAQNGADTVQRNQYAAWWYCCIPMKRIHEIGYPLPIFIKNDDIEYSIRNNRQILSFNGIGVWHQLFDSKHSPVMSYYSYRNSLIIQHYVENCGRLSLLLAIILKGGKRFLRFGWSELHMLAKAVEDYSNGFEKITSLPADQFMQSVIEYAKKDFSFADLTSLIRSCIHVLFGFKELDREYKSFQNKHLSDSAFWKKFFQQKW